MESRSKRHTDGSRRNRKHWATRLNVMAGSTLWRVVLRTYKALGYDPLGVAIPPNDGGLGRWLRTSWISATRVCYSFFRRLSWDRLAIAIRAQLAMFANCARIA